MEFLWGGRLTRETVALLPGAWNPPTLAHLAMAEASLSRAEEAVLVLPRAFPHKAPEGAPLERRAEWLVALAATRPGLAVAWSEGGLFIDMAREVRRALSASRVLLVCGRDAAERIVGWDYGAGDSIERQLDEYELLVAPRQGDYVPPAALAARVHALHLGDGWHEVSSSEVRARIAAGQEWASLVPAEIRDSVRAAY
jgi:nicotinate-nucleotide adenylyltransferase